MADLSISPVHTAAIGVQSHGKGIGLRFPRFVRVRDDKNVQQATRAKEIVELYLQQSHVQQMGNAGGKLLDDDDFDF